MEINNINNKLKEIYGNGGLKHIPKSKIQPLLDLNIVDMKEYVFDMNLYSACAHIDKYTLPISLKTKIVDGTYKDYKDLFFDFKFKSTPLYFTKSMRVEDYLFTQSMIHHNYNKEFVTDRLKYMLSKDSISLIIISLDNYNSKVINTCVLNETTKTIYIEEDTIKETLMYLLEQQYKGYKIIDKDFTYDDTGLKTLKGGFVFT